MKNNRSVFVKGLSFFLALVLFAIPFSFSGAEKVLAASPVRLYFNDPSCMSSFTYSNNLLVQYSENEEAVMMAVAGDDPFVLLNVEGKLDISADTYKYVVVTYRVPTTNSAQAATTELFMCAGDIAVPTGGYSVSFNPTRGYKYRSEVINMSGESYWSGKIHSIRFDAFTSGAVWDAFYLSSVTFCQNLSTANAAAATAASDANGTLDGISEGLLASNIYNLGTYTQKYWSGDIVYNETVYPLCSSDGTIAPSRLMYDIKKVISVRDGTLGTEYKYGRDYIITSDGRFQVMPSGSIPKVAYSSYYSATLPSANSSSWMLCRDGRYTYFSENGDFHRAQIAITYTHEDSWNGYVPESKVDVLEKTYRKLQNKERLSVVFFGDSVSVGCNASGLSSINVAPYMPLWSEMTIAGLKAKYGYNNISYVNTAVGGTMSSWGAEQASARVAAHNPDLVFIGFGTNDGTGGVAASVYDANMRSIIDTVRSVNPNCEFVLVSPVMPNEETYFAGVQESYIPVLEQIESDYDGVAAANLMTFYKQLLTRKKYSDMTGNNVNHPNDFFIRYYAQTLLTMLSPSDISEAREDALRALDSYVSLSDYREAEQQQIQTIVSNGKSEINAAGTISEIRAALSDAKALIDQVKTAAEYEAEELDYTYLRFNSSATLTTIKKTNNVSPYVNASLGATSFTSTGNDPYFRVSYIDRNVSANEYKYIVLIYNVPSTVTNATPTQIFLTTTSSTGESEASSVSFKAEKGSFAYELIDLSEASYWSGNIRNIRIDPFATYSAGDSFDLHTIRLFRTFEEASVFGSRTTSILSGNYTGITETVRFDTEPSVARLSSSGQDRFIGDINTDGRINAQDITLLKKIIACISLSGVDLELADVNRDGKINAKDSNLLKKGIAGLYTLPLISAPTADISLSEEEFCAALETSAESAVVTADLSDKNLSADDFKYVSLVYRNDTDSGMTVTVSAPDAPGAAFTAVQSSEYQTATLDLSAASGWNGELDSLNITFDGARLCLGALIVSETRSGAESKAAAEALALNRMTGNYVPVSGQTVVPMDDSTTMAAFSGYSSATGDIYAFSSSLTFTLDRQPAEKFDRLTLKYTSSTMARGIVTYNVNGSLATDEFFLEAASSEASFRTVVPGYFKGETASDIVSVTIYPCCASATAFSLKGISTEDCDNYNGEIFLQNSEVKLGVLLTMGGGISHYEKLDDNNESYSNLLNRYDVGRLIQQSYYGIDRAPYVLGKMGNDPWGYNPVQGGDGHNNPSQIVDLEVLSDRIYVKTRAMDWGHDGHLTPSYMENWYILYDSFVKVDNRFVDFSGYTHTVGWQELPAFYTVSALNNFMYYNGSSPWTGDALTVRSDLIFWGATNNQAFDLKTTSEFWSAWCDNSGFGVGLYVPGVYTLHAGKFGYDGSPSPYAASTNYVAPRRNMTLICGKPLIYSYLIAAGNIGTIRETFKNNRGLINNYSLETYN